MALVLVLVAAGVAATLSYSFIESQSTTIGIAKNVGAHGSARGVAESAMRLAIAYMSRTDSTWRSDQVDGTWVTDEAFGGGKFTIVGEDGWDDNGDGVITEPDEGDGDLSDDQSDLATLTVTAEVNGSVHILRAVVTPVPGRSKKVLFFVPNPSDLSDAEKARKVQFESWGYDVTPMDDAASQSAIDEAALEADVAYVAQSATNSRLGLYLQSLSIGVLNEQVRFTRYIGFGYFGVYFTGDSIDIIDTNHYITQNLSTGSLTVTSQSETLNRLYAAGGRRWRRFMVAPGLTTLATFAGSFTTLGVVDAGGLLVDNSKAAGRRVFLPWGGGSFQFSSLNDAGRELLKRAMEWAAVPPPTIGPILHYDFSSQAGTTVADRVGDVDLTLEPGNGSIQWVTDSDAGAGIYFNQNAQSGTAIAKTANTGVADSLKTALKATNAFTIQAFIMAEGFDNSGGRIVSFSRNTRTNDRNFTLMGDNDGSNAVDLEGRMKYSTRVTGYRVRDVFGLNKFHVLAYTVNLNQRGYNIKLYVDGELEQSWYRPGNFRRWTREDFMLGNEKTLNRPFKGYMYDVKVWDSALSGTQLLENANKLLPSDSTGPQLIAEYKFIEVLPPDPVLIHHWKLDEAADGSGGGAAASDSVKVKNNAFIDSYDSTVGVYGGANITSSARVSSNSTGRDRFYVASNAKINGNAYCGNGGDPNNVIDADAEDITGTQEALTSNVPMPSVSAPSMGPDEGNVTFSNDATIDTDRHFKKFKIQNNAIITINGNVTILCDDTFEMKNNAKIVIPDGSSLALYVDAFAWIRNDAQLNPDTGAPDKLKFYGIDGNQDFKIERNAIVSADLYTKDDFKMYDQSVFYGRAHVLDDIEIEDNTRMHLDTSLGSLVPDVLPAVDAVAVHNGSYTNGAMPGETGVDGNAARFDGSNDYVLIPHNDSMLLNNGTVAFWFKSDRLSGRRGLFSKDSSGYDTGGHLTIYTDGTRVKARLQSTNNTYTVESSGALRTGIWYHVAFAFGPGGMKLYLDGQEVDSDSYSGGLGTSSGGAGNYEPATLGTNIWGSGNRTHQTPSDYFSGWLDDVRIYDQPLDATQAANLFDDNPIGSSTGPGTVVQDTSGFGTALDLTIENVNNTAWIDGGGLDFTASTKALSAGPATKLYTALTATDEMTLEVKFTPANLSQGGPARIASYSYDSGSRNFTFGQSQSKYTQRVRTTSTSGNGTPDINSPDVLTTQDVFHVVVTFKDDRVKMYRDGVLEVDESRSGSFSNWSTNQWFVLANEYRSSRPWVGKLYRVAIYDRAVSPSQANDLYMGSPPQTDAGVGGYTYSVDWQEGP